MKAKTCVLVLCTFLLFAESSLAQDSTKQAATSKPAEKQTPSLKCPAKAVFTVGKPGTLPVEAVGSPKPTITAAETDLPAGLSFDPSTGKLQGTPTRAGSYKINFTVSNASGSTISQSCPLTVQAAASAQPSGAPCIGATYTVRLRSLQDVDVDGLAKALNNTFGEFSMISAPEATNSGSKQNLPPSSASPPSSSASGTDGQGNSSSPKQFLCVYLRDTDPKTGHLAVIGRTAVPPDLDRVIRLLDRPEFAGIQLDERFLVQLSHVPPSRLVSAFPLPAPGFELHPEDVVGQCLILHPASTDLQLAAKAGGDMASQAAKIKHDFQVIDAQLGKSESEGPARQLVESYVANVPDPADGNFLTAFRGALKALEKWDAENTMRFAVLNPADVALRLGEPGGLFPYRDMFVLAQQRAIVLRPLSVQLHPQVGVLVASDALDRNSIFHQSKAEQAWEQQLQSDGASSTKGSGNSESSPSPVTTSTSKTTITTPGSTSGTSAPKTASSMVVQTTTSTQTTTGGSAQGGPSQSPSSQNSGSGSVGPSSNSATSTNSSSGAGGSSSPGSQGQGAITGTTGLASQVATSVAQQQVPTGTVVRLFHLRQAANISTVVNAMGAGPNSAPLVQPLADYGNDDLLLILPPAAGQPDHTESIRRVISHLDEPRPAISLQVWSYEISSEQQKKSDDYHGRVERAKRISERYASFIRVVQEADSEVQEAMAAGLATAINMTRGPVNSFFDPDFLRYLTQTSKDCLRADDYCLGYDTALNYGPPGLLPTSPNTRATISLGRFVILLAAAKDTQIQELITETIDSMNSITPRDANDPNKPLLIFPRFSRALRDLAQPSNLHLFRAAMLDFLFQYKWSLVYPNDFEPYYLQRSAQTLDGYLNALTTTFNRDLDSYLDLRLGREPRPPQKGIGLANYGEVQVNAISGDPAKVSGSVNNYFDITQPALLKDILSGLLGGAGGSGQASPAPSGSSGGTTPTTPSTSTSPAPATGSSPAASALASASRLLTPWQAVALNALATASAPPQLVAQINAQTTLAVTPISLDTASAAELYLSLQISNPTSTVDASKGATSSFIRQDLANSVANYNVQTQVRVDSFKLFQVSSLSIDLTHPQTTVPVPVVGWIYEGLFGTVPWMNDHILAVRRAPKTVENRSIAVVRAVVVPTSMDLGLSLPFRADSIEDPVTMTVTELSSAAQTSNKFREFHKRFIACILEPTPNDLVRPRCMDKIQLSQIPEQAY